MTRRRKSRRRMVYSTTAGFHDGSVITCWPERKPSAKKIKEDGLHVDEDGAFREVHYSPNEWHSWDVEQRVKAVTILANRLNTRRAIRDLVLPKLEAIASVQLDIQKRLERIEHAIGTQSQT